MSSVHTTIHYNIFNSFFAVLLLFTYSYMNNEDPNFIGMFGTHTLFLHQRLACAARNFQTLEHWVCTWPHAPQKTRRLLGFCFCSRKGRIAVIYLQFGKQQAIYYGIRASIDWRILCLLSHQQLYSIPEKTLGKDIVSVRLTVLLFLLSFFLSFF